MGRMYERGTDNIFYAICNTDFQDLNRSDVPCKITLGENLCNGRGCGANSKKGKAAAEESIDEISSLFGDGSIVFVIAGMGGGTGTGAAPVIAKTAKEKGHLTIGVVTMPFSWEQENRINKAKDGLRNMLATTDAIMVFNNQQISRTYEDRPVSEGFKEADDIIASATLGIADIVENPDKINLDQADITAVLKNSGVAIMNTGEADGENRVIQALTNAVEHPLLKGRDIGKSSYILIHISSPKENEITLGELNGVNEFVEKFSKKGNISLKEIFWGLSVRDEKGSKCRVTLIATGFTLDDVCDWHLYEREKNKPSTGHAPIIDLDDWA